MTQQLKVSLFVHRPWIEHLPRCVESRLFWYAYDHRWLRKFLFLNQT